MIPKHEIKAFLQNFHIKMDIWGIIVRDDRGKNTQTLLDLEITKDYRNKVLKELDAEDYSEGPLEEKLHGGADMWVFGKLVKGKEIYIKITMGIPGSKVICISFHAAEHRMTYPYKAQKEN
jgi:hypothetical protein